MSGYTLSQLEAQQATIEAAIAEVQAQSVPVHDERVVSIVAEIVIKALSPLGDYERDYVLEQVFNELPSADVVSAQALNAATDYMQGRWGAGWADKARQAVSSGAITLLDSAMQDALLAWQQAQAAPAMTIATAQPAKVQAVAVAGHKSDSQGRVVYNKRDKATWTANLTAKKIAHLPDGRAVDVSAATSLNRIGLLVTAAQRGCDVKDVGSQGNQGFRMTPTGQIVYHVPEGEVTFS